MNAIKVVNVDYADNFENTGANAVFVTLECCKKEITLLEWVNEGGLAERTDSHIQINQSREVAEFLEGSGLDSSHGVPEEIYAIIDIAIKNGPHGVMGWAADGKFGWLQV